MLSKNVINEVMKEWSWRVSTGMPDITKTEDLKLLREVLIDDFNLSVYDANKIIEALSKGKFVKALLLDQKVKNMLVIFIKENLLIYLKPQWL